MTHLSRSNVTSIDQMSSIVQKTLVEPKFHNHFDKNSVRCARHIIAGLKAAHTLQKPLVTFKAHGLSWAIFEQSEEVVNMMIAATRNCQHLAIHLSPQDGVLDGSGHTKGKESMATMASRSILLDTLDISFNYGNVFASLKRKVKLPEIFKAGHHWPNLKRMKLQGFGTTDASLMEVLSTHANTLESLELAFIHLENNLRDGEKCPVSWIEMFFYLHNSLNLRYISLRGELANDLDEMWCFRELGPNDRDWGEGPGKPSQLKHRIERFIVEGGICPLPNKLDVRISGSWGDQSCYFRCRH